MANEKCWICDRPGHFKGGICPPCRKAPSVGDDVEECATCGVYVHYTREPFATVPHGKCGREPIEVNW